MRTDDLSPQVTSLRRAVIRKVGPEALKKVASNGADYGTPGFRYTNDCVAFYRRHAHAIWELLAQEAAEIHETVPQMIAGFRHVRMTQTKEQFENLLAWYAVEQIARMECADEAPLPAISYSRRRTSHRQEPGKG